MNGNEEVVCFGSVMVDVVFTGLDHAPRINEELYTSEFVVDIGGGAAIAAVALSGLGCSASVISVVGTDLLGDFIASRMLANGVNTDYLQRHPGGSNISLEISFAEGRATTTGLGIPRLALPRDCISLLRRSRHLHVVGPITEDHEAILNLAHDLPLKISLDPNCLMRGSKPLFERLLPKIDFILPNKQEADGWDDLRNTSAIARALGSRMRSDGLCVMKLGADGAIASDGCELFQVKAPIVPVVDTTGAGDIFAAGMIYSSFRGFDINRSLRIANALGAASVSTLGGTRSIVAQGGLDKLLFRDSSDCHDVDVAQG